MSLPVSVLDLVGMRTDESAGSAIARSVDLARQVEKLGYRRFWLAEHHSIEGLACSATALLIERVASATETIRVGSGGVMLPNHAPLVVAEQFGTLEALFPGRIDLGLGAAPRSAANGRGLSGVTRRVAELSWTGEAGAGGQSDSRPRQQCADHAVGFERLQRAIGGGSGIAFCLRRTLRARSAGSGLAAVSRELPAERDAPGAVADGRRPGDRGRNRPRGAAAVHDAAATLSAPDSQPAGGAAASGGFDGRGVERLGEDACGR